VEGAKGLASKLHHCTQLQRLDLHHNNLNDEAAKAIVSGLKCCTKLVSLNFFDNCISDKFARTVTGREKYEIFL
jgi:Ran GTPase-activating protein (RanGAP) involved in mRNA processing and transport